MAGVGSLLIMGNTSFDSPKTKIGDGWDGRRNINKQLCAGFRNPERRILTKKFFEFNKRKKRKFREIDPFHFDIDIKVCMRIKLFRSESSVMGINDIDSDGMCLLFSHRKLIPKSDTGEIQIL